MNERGAPAGAGKAVGQCGPAGELLLNQVKPLLKASRTLRHARYPNGMRTRLDLVVDNLPRRRPVRHLCRSSSSSSIRRLRSVSPKCWKIPAPMPSMMKPM